MTTVVPVVTTLGVHGGWGWDPSIPGMGLGPWSRTRILLHRYDYLRSCRRDPNVHRKGANEKCRKNVSAHHDCRVISLLIQLRVAPQQRQDPSSTRCHPCRPETEVGTARLGEGFVWTYLGRNVGAPERREGRPDRGMRRVKERWGLRQGPGGSLWERRTVRTRAT